MNKYKIWSFYGLRKKNRVLFGTIERTRSEQYVPKKNWVLFGITEQTCSEQDFLVFSENFSSKIRNSVFGTK